MREILFRGKTKHGGEWVYGGVCCSAGNTIIVSFSERILTTIEGKRVLPETVGQYTGLTDKNGKKIFEGDIVRIAYWFGWDDEQEKVVPEEEYISKIYSIDGCPFCVDLIHCDGDMTPIAWLDWSYDDAEIEVVGNIHDNPELLEGE